MSQGRDRAVLVVGPAWCQSEEESFRPSEIRVITAESASVVTSPDLAVLGDVLEQPPHDRAGTRLGQLGHDHDLPGRAIAPISLATRWCNFCTQGVALAFLVRLGDSLLAQDDERPDRLTGGVISGTEPPRPRPPWGATPALTQDTTKRSTHHDQT